MSETTQEFWRGRFGRDYHVRNRVDWQARMPFWESAIDFCAPLSVLEVGCGPGWNLMALQAIKPSLDAYGVDVNQDAVNEARAAGLEVQCTDALGIRALHDVGSIDLVFTAGMLIHVAPVDLQNVMRAIVDISGRYVIAIEYEDETTVEVEYRGHSGRLWRRPYGKLYEAMGLRLLSTGTAAGFDACTYWLLDKEVV